MAFTDAYDIIASTSYIIIVGTVLEYWLGVIRNVLF